MIIRESSKYSIVRLSNGDIPAIHQLTTLVGWDYTVADVTTIFQTGLVFGHKEANGILISTAAIFPYNNQFASIGMVIVHPDYRGAGLGREVTQECLDHFPKMPVMLVATEQGIPIYKKMGFIKVDGLHKLIANKYIPSDLHSSLYRCRMYRDTDFSELIKLDEDAFGVKREGFLEVRIKQSKKQMVIVDSKENIVGFGLSNELPNMLLIGPVIAPNPVDAGALVHNLVDDYEGKVRIDIPSQKSELVELLLQCGFEIVNQPPIMVINTMELPKRNGSLYGIAAQAFG
jgi:N-acetylglutamate synthase-like GNAT family acetyltransferase